MPKPLKMMLEIEEAAFGRVFRALDGMPGVVAMTPIGDGPKVKGPAGKKGKGGTVYCIVLRALIEADKAVNRDVLRDVLKAHGKAATSLPDALTKLQRAKHITNKNAMYSVTPAGRKHYETSCPIEE
jgi:hypothetical protein